MLGLLAAAMVMGATGTCSRQASGAGADEEVPVRLTGWSADDAAWLEGELAAWVGSRERTLCRPAGGGDAGLTIERGELEAVITFVFGAERRTRSVSASSDASLFRYQVAAAAEELVRSTWEALPSGRFALLLRGDASVFLGGQWLAGGGAGAGYFLVPSLLVDLTADVAALRGLPLSTGGDVGGLQLGGTLGVSWLPIQASAFRAGPRASFSLGALSVRVQQSGVADTTGLSWWVVARGGAALGFQTRRVLVLALAEAGWAFAGAAVEVEGVRAQSIRGFDAQFGVQAGWLW